MSLESMASVTNLQTASQRFLPTPVWTVLSETVSRLSSLSRTRRPVETRMFPLVVH